MALIETVDLWKTYVMGSEEIHALRGVSIVIERGERGVHEQRVAHAGSLSDKGRYVRAVEPA